jgi:hypothetical protein
MGKCKTKDSLPFYARRAISGYRPHLRDAIAQAVQAKSNELKAMGQSLTDADIRECVGAVVGDLIAGDRNVRMEQMSLDAYRRGDYKLLKDVINELRTSIADPPSA